MSSQALIASSRMYNVSEQVRPLWDSFFRYISAAAEVPLKIVEHRPPAPLADLWQRSNLGAAFICGYPLATWQRADRPVILAAPVADAPWALGGTRYASHIIVAKGGRISDPAQLAAAIWGWTVRDSQSGYHAPRAYFAKTWPGHAPQQTVGPLLNPTGVIEALRDRRIEAGAIDTYAYRLLEIHDPAAIEGVEVIATSEPTPCPVLAVSATVAPVLVARLRDTLLQAHENVKGKAALAALSLLRFETADLADYAQLPRCASETDRRLAPW